MPGSISKTAKICRVRLYAWYIWYNPYFFSVLIILTWNLRSLLGHSCFCLLLRKPYDKTVTVKCVCVDWFWITIKKYEGVVVEIFTFVLILYLRTWPGKSTCRHVYNFLKVYSIHRRLWNTYAVPEVCGMTLLTT